MGRWLVQSEYSFCEAINTIGAAGAYRWNCRRKESLRKNKTVSQTKRGFAKQGNDVVCNPAAQS